MFKEKQVLRRAAEETAPYTVERVIFAPAIFSRFFENEVFAQCYFRGSRRSRKKHGRGKK